MAKKKAPVKKAVKKVVNKNKGVSPAELAYNIAKRVHTNDIWIRG